MMKKDAPDFKAGASKGLRHVKNPAQTPAGRVPEGFERGSVVVRAGVTGPVGISS